MAENRFLNQLAKKKLLLSDGATATNLMARGLPQGKAAEEWILDKPEEILKLHKDFINAGAEIILTCTFGGSKMRLEQSGLGSQFEAVNRRAVELALEAAHETGNTVAGSMGPLGSLLKPSGPIEEKDAEENYKAQATLLRDGGVDLILIETQFDVHEAMAAIRGALSASSLPIVCSFSFDRGTRTMMGVSPSEFAGKIGGMGITALGINCGKSLSENLRALRELSHASELPIWFKPSVGLPTLDLDGKPTYGITPQEMAAAVPEWIHSRARIIGGCCGTSPDHLRSLALKIRQHQQNDSPC